jgi:hypothetical protein
MALFELIKAGNGWLQVRAPRQEIANAHPNRASKISAANARTIPTISDR